MAVGRISGPLLQNNLERNGIDLTFADTNPNSPLLKLDVTNNKVMVAGTTSTADLHVHGTLNGVILGITSSFDTGDLDFSGNTLNNFNVDISSVIYLNTNKRFVKFTENWAGRK